MPERDVARGNRRRRRPRRDRPESAAAVIASVKPPVDDKPADVPLSPAEVGQMRAHLRFLKEHRRLLNLKVNAAEDLLLNGAREPTHRGVCQHLLDKVDRHRVEQAVQRLDPQSCTRLLEGILRFSPDVAYLLLYLESLKDAARPDAPAALFEALRHIDFAAVSAAQLRRLLDLIVELVDERARPELVLGLLESATFQDALDKSAERLPQALADLVIPLRAAHAVILRGSRNPHDEAALAAGTTMLLKAHERVLRSLSAATRQRLLELGLGLSTSGEQAAGLGVLLDTLPKDDRATSDAALRYAGWLLSAGLEQKARGVLSELVRSAPGFRLPARWLEALDGPRIGRIGLTERPRGGDGQLESGRFQSGVLLTRQLSVWVKVGAPSDAERFAGCVALWQSIAIPGLAPVVDSGVTKAGAPYLAIPRLGRGANEALRQGGGPRPAEALRIAAEGARLLGALGAVGVRLPDARALRFALDDGGRLWLRDLLDAVRVSPAEAAAAHTELGRDFCRDVLGTSDRLLLPARARAQLDAAADCVALVRALEAQGGV